MMIEFAEYIETDDITEDWLRYNHFSFSEDRGWSIILPPSRSEAAIVELSVAFRNSHWFVFLSQGTPRSPKSGDDIISLSSLPLKLTKTHLIQLVKLLGVELK